MSTGEHRQTRSTVLSDLLVGLDESMRSGETASLAPIPTGFQVFDDTVGGGLRPGDVVLVGGPPGVGKTIVTLQWARHAALTGHRAIYICYEHDENTLLLRLLAQECAHIDPTYPTRDLPDRLRAASAQGRGLREAFSDDAVIGPALARMDAYAGLLLLVRASGAHTALEHIDDLIYQFRDAPEQTVAFVDYLQKVALLPEPENEAEKVTRLIEGLKDLALTNEVPIVTISAVSNEGLDANRIRLHHLRGSSALGFEADVVLMLNDKMKAVSRVHLAYDSTAEKRFKEQVVFSIEKNRGGPNLIDLEYRKDFRHFRFHEDGGVVTERLVSERLDEQAV